MNTLISLPEVPAYALTRKNGHEIVSPSFTSKWCEEIVAYCPKCENEISAFYFDLTEDCGGYWTKFRSAPTPTNKSGECTNKSGACL